MRRQRRRPVYYATSAMNDGTVMTAYPVRKRPEKLMKRDGHTLDEDGVCREFIGSYVDRFDWNDPGRLRFFDIMANRLNTRRAIRELVLPEITSLRTEVAELREQASQLIAICARQNSA